MEKNEFLTDFTRRQKNKMDGIWEENIGHNLSFGFLDIQTKGAQYAFWSKTCDRYDTRNHLKINKSHGFMASYVRVEAGKKPLLFYEENLDD